MAVVVRIQIYIWSDFSKIRQHPVGSRRVAHTAQPEIIVRHISVHWTTYRTTATRHMDHSSAAADRTTMDGRCFIIIEITIGGERLSPGQLQVSRV